MIEIDKILKEKYKGRGYTLLLKPTHDCNIHCTYCYDRVAQKTYGKGIMTKETFKRVIDMMNNDERKCAEFIFHGGEPLMAGYDWYEWALDYVTKNLNYTVSFSMQSNGRLLNKKFLDLFKKYNLKVGLSYDFYPEGVVGFRQNIDKEKLRVLTEYDKLSKPRIVNGAICVVSKKNLSYVEQAFEDTIDMNLNGVSMNFIFPTDEIKETQKNLFFTKEEYRGATRKILNLYKEKDMNFPFERGVFQLLSLLNGGTYTCCNHSDCRFGWVGVGPTGALAHCDTYTNDAFYLGTIYDYDALTDFQYSRGYKNIVAARDEKRNIACKYCKLNDICRGVCFSNSLNSNNNAISFYTNACNEIKYGVLGVYESIRDFDIYAQDVIMNQISFAFITNDYYTPLEIQRVIKKLFGVDYLEDKKVLSTPDKFFASKEYLIYRKINPVQENRTRVITFNTELKYSDHINEKILENVRQNFTSEDVKGLREESIIKTILMDKKYFETLLGKEVKWNV